MPSSKPTAPTVAEIAERYFDLLHDQDVDGAVALWEPGATDRFVGQTELVAPDGIATYFRELFAAFPDFRLERIESTKGRNSCAIRWRATGTFAGPGRFQGFRANGARVAIEGCDVIVVRDGRIVGNTAYTDSGDIARQLGVLPPAGSGAERRLTGLANLQTRMKELLAGAAEEAIAPGVWILRGGRPRNMNVYLIEDEGGITVFDAGIAAMTDAVAAAGARLGGIRRVVLGHADADHRGAAPGLDVPVLCHPLERAAAESDSPFRDYWDFELLGPVARRAYPHLLKSWDGGRAQIADTVQDGDEIAGFRVVHLPGHAPGLIGLFRAEDRLALVSDCFYTVNPETGRKRPAGVPHPAFNEDTEQARASIRALAALDPAVAWAGHTDPVTGDVAAQLHTAAAA